MFLAQLHLQFESTLEVSKNTSNALLTCCVTILESQPNNLPFIIYSQIVSFYGNNRNGQAEILSV